MEELKILPPPKLEKVSDYIRQLQQVSLEERLAILRQTSGILSAVDADIVEQVIAADCERVDVRDW